MDTMEKLVAQIQGLSGSAGDLNQLYNILKQSEDSLRLNSSRLAPFLNQLDPSLHSLGYLYFLDAYTSSVSRDGANEVALLVARFISSCLAEQIRLAQHKFISVCRRLKDQAIVLAEPMRGVAPMLSRWKWWWQCLTLMLMLHVWLLLLVRTLCSRCFIVFG